MSIRSTRRSLLALCAALALMPLAAVAEQVEGDGARLATARALFKAMGSEAQMDAATGTMFQALAQMFRQKSPAHAREIDEVMRLVQDKLQARKSELLDMVAPLYAERFTTQELSEIAGFFNSEIGKKLVREQPGLIQRSMQVGMTWGQKLGAEVEAEMRAELKKRGIDL